MMIRNKKQAAVTRHQIRELEERLRRTEAKRPKTRAVELTSSSLKCTIADLTDQILLYEEAVEGRVRWKMLWTLLSPERQRGRPNFGAAIFVLRTAAGLTQKQMARRMKTKQEAIARWERDDYMGFTFDTLSRAFEALGYGVDLRLKKLAN